MSPEGILSRLAKKHVIYSYCIVASTPLGPIWHWQCKEMLTWDNLINSVRVPIEVGKFQSDSSRPNLSFFEILCVQMAPESILSRLAKKHGIYSYCIVAKTPLGPLWRWQCRELLTWGSAINSVHVPIEVGKFQSDSSRPNLMIFAILCVKMVPEGILSRLAKKQIIYSYCIVVSWHRPVSYTHLTLPTICSV